MTVHSIVEILTLKSRCRNSMRTPEITGQEQLRTNEDNAIVLKMSDIRVNDPDDEYPRDFSLTINPGPNYSINGLTITPAQNFAGVLSIPVVVNDGRNDSQPFNLQITVSSC